MTTIRTRRPSPALVVAALALVLSLGGTAYAATVAPANSVRTASIKDGEVRSRDILNRTIKGLDVADGSLGPRALGTKSVTSDELAPIFTVTATSAATGDSDGMTNGGTHNVAAATAQCPAGSDLIGGGARWVEPSNVGTGNGAVYLQEQYRSGAGDDWTVEGIVDFGASGTIKLQSLAYCLTAQP